MIIKNNQSGVGLIEVLVSLLLLSVAVLGFSTLQMKSVKATDESLKRTQAMSIARGLSESLRINPKAIDAVMRTINDNNPTTTLVPGVAARPGFAAIPAIPSKTIDLTSCNSFTNGCSAEGMIIKDTLTVLQNAGAYEIGVGMEVCPGTGAGNTNENSEVACIVVAWNTTSPFTANSTRTLPDGNTHCADINSNYISGSDCIIIEAY